LTWRHCDRCLERPAADRPHRAKARLAGRPKRTAADVHHIFEDRDWATGRTSSVIASIQLNIRTSTVEFQRRRPADRASVKSVNPAARHRRAVPDHSGAGADPRSLLARSITGSCTNCSRGRNASATATSRNRHPRTDQLGEPRRRSARRRASKICCEQAEKKRLGRTRIAHEIRCRSCRRDRSACRGCRDRLRRAKVGGDCYDFFRSATVSGSIADVSGKGPRRLYSELKGLMLSRAAFTHVRSPHRRDRIIAGTSMPEASSP
jgi:hypothetical protein